MNTDDNNLVVDEAIIEEMKKITALTGRISSFQEVHLRQWPFVLFSNIKSISIDYDLTPTGDFDSETETYVVDRNTWVKYRILFKDKTKREKGFDKRCQDLASWVQFLFWNDLKVEVFVNKEKKPRFDSVKRRKNDGNDSKTAAT